MVSCVRPRLLLCLAASIALPTLSPPGAAASPSLLAPPVDGVVVRHFVDPAGPYGPGHRGIDYAAEPGAGVRAAAAGTVAFAGPVGGELAVSIDHDGGLRTTYSILADTLVRAGDEVGQGSWIGVAGGSHPGAPDGLHFGVKLRGAYVDPEAWLGPLDVSEAIHLAPLEATEASRCPEAVPLEGAPPPPNDNVAVAIAGIATSTSHGGAAPLDREFLKDGLGYRGGSVYAFSYRGLGGPRLHRPYDAADTYGDLRGAARRLRRLLQAIARAHPGADVDLVAHSQGGIVASVMLEQMAHSWDPSLPRVDHVVTFATPHRGTPIADVPAILDDTLVGTLALRALSALAAGRLPLPPAASAAVEDLRPGSPMMAALARRDVVFGSRVLSLAAPNDILVPADRSMLVHEGNRLVHPTGLWGHSAILASEEARVGAYDFLRDAPAACAARWEGLGRLAGRALGLAYEGLPRLLRAVEDVALGPVAGGLRRLLLGRKASG